MPSNPLKRPILEILHTCPQGLSEHELITALRKTDALPAENADSSQDLALFQLHFLVMNALYQLQNQLAADNLCLHISALHIQLEQDHGSPANALINGGSDSELKAYYLDWTHLESADDESVKVLLNNFWERYLATDKQLEALTTLGLETGASWPEVRLQYRRLASQHHPDKGGSDTRFQQIRSAFETLALCMDTRD